MSEPTRVHQSVKNAKVGIIFVIVNTLLQFLVRKTFLVHLGTEVLGLNTSAQNLLQFLNLAELGVGAAIGFALYKPLFEHDEHTINEIMALQGHLYRRIAFVVIGGALLLSAFFPLIFHKMQLPLWYAYASFGVLLFSALLSYFVNYTQVLLSADQREYTVVIHFRSWLMVRLVAQYFTVRFLPHPYIWWLVCEVVFTIVASVSLRRAVRRAYPYLQTRSYVKNAGDLRRKYPEIVTKIKQLFFHKISLYVLQQTSPLIIYAYATLGLVALYGNYVYIVTGFALLSNALFMGSINSVGNLIAEGNQQKIMHVFHEVFTLRFVASLLMAWFLYIIGQPFIILWVGEEYLLPNSTLLIMAATLFLNTSGNTVESFLQGYGMYQDIWAPMVEAVLNLGLSILFGAFWGLNGILCGVLASRVFILFFWKPIFLYHWAFKVSLWHYVRMYLLHAVAAAVAILLWYLLSGLLRFAYSTSWLTLIGQGIATAAIICVIAYVVFLLFTPGMRMLTARLMKKNA